MKRLMNRIVLPLAILLAAIAPQLQADDKQSEQAEATLRILTGESEIEAAIQSKIMIGIALAPVGPTLQSQLGIDGGVVVSSVLEKSPAVEAGIQIHDVIVEYGGRKITTPGDLTQAVAKVGVETVEVKLIRKAKEIKVKVTPIEREESLPEPREQEELRKKLEELLNRIGDPELSERRMLWVSPLILQQQGDADARNLPENMRITVNKAGEQPAKISVKIDSKSWEVTEDSLDELPENVRKHVEVYLDRDKAPEVEEFRIRLKRELDAATKPESDSEDSHSRALNAARQQVIRIQQSREGQEKALDEMRKAQAEILKAIERLQKQVAELKQNQQ